MDHNAHIGQEVSMKSPTWSAPAGKGSDYVALPEGSLSCRPLVAEDLCLLHKQQEAGMMQASLPCPVTAAAAPQACPGFYL